jgi:hypothetical protein
MLLLLAWRQKLLALLRTLPGEQSLLNHQCRQGEAFPLPVEGLSG